MHAASVAGKNADHNRVPAIVFSSVLADWGQIIFLQNIGTLNTYNSHEQVGTFAIAALLIGGATVPSFNGDFTVSDFICCFTHGRADALWQRPGGRLFPSLCSLRDDCHQSNPPCLAGKISDQHRENGRFFGLASPVAGLICHHHEYSVISIKA